MVAQDTNQFAGAPAAEFARVVRRRARRLVDQTRVLARYGTTRPSEVLLSDGCTPLLVDPGDERVYRFLVLKSWRPYYSRVQAFWRAASRRYAPTTVVDVGVNAGECLFGTRYPDDACVVGFEANPRLQPLLERNRKRHPNGDRITLVDEIASARTAQAMPFYIDEMWSGKSSVVPGVATNPDAASVVRVGVTTVDTVLSSRAASLERLLFKIDVEGHERAVLSGMLHSLERSGSAIGLMEFDEGYLQCAGVETAVFLAELQARFRVLAFDGDERLFDVDDLTSLRRRVSDDPCHTDFVLLAGPEAERFGAWAAAWPTCSRSA